MSAQMHHAGVNSKRRSKRLTHFRFGFNQFESSRRKTLDVLTNSRDTRRDRV
jgi:hypothetical protein